MVGAGEYWALENGGRWRMAGAGEGKGWRISCWEESPRNSLRLGIIA